MPTGTMTSLQPTGSLRRGHRTIIMTFGAASLMYLFLMSIKLTSVAHKEVHGKQFAARLDEFRMPIMNKEKVPDSKDSSRTTRMQNEIVDRNQHSSDPVTTEQDSVASEKKLAIQSMASESKIGKDDATFAKPSTSAVTAKIQEVTNQKAQLSSSSSSSIQSKTSMGVHQRRSNLIQSSVQPAFSNGIGEQKIDDDDNKSLAQNVVPADDISHKQLSQSDTSIGLPKAVEGILEQSSEVNVTSIPSQRVVDYLGDFLDQPLPEDRDPLLLPSNKARKLPLTPTVEHLGVLLDAGRHYYPMEWLYHLIDYLELIGFNLLHFRLTDDQAFNIRLDSRPNMANPAEGSNGTVYTPTELRALVQYAKSKNIVIMPEINVPGHAGGFAGSIPNLIVPCTNFICTKGYGMILNASNPELISVLRDVLTEIKDIFSTTPFFHLGGDEVDMAATCVDEMGLLNGLDFTDFEARLGNLINELGIPRDKIVRWEMTGMYAGADMKTRVKGIDQYWLSFDYQTKTPLPRVLVSAGLYFDTNDQKNGFRIYDHTRSLIYRKTTSTVHASYKPLGIIAGAFELGVKFWMDRNIVGRLLAVAMGASTEEYKDNAKFDKQYMKYCNMLDLPGRICAKIGVPMVPESFYKADWAMTTKKWANNVCDRLVAKEVVQYIPISSRRMKLQANEATSLFWNNFLSSKTNQSINTFSINTTVSNVVDRPMELKNISTHIIQYTGIILDLTLDGAMSSVKLKRIMTILDYISDLGFNMVQLRVVSDSSFAVMLEEQRSLVYGATNLPWKVPDLREIVEHAAHRGIQVMAELTVLHRAGGWFHAVPMAPCPKKLCYFQDAIQSQDQQQRREPGSFTWNTTSVSVLSSLSGVLREFRKVFSSPFVHLGYDERKESMACLEEAGMDPEFDKFERKIEKLLKYDGIPLDRVLRWENEEQTKYNNRAGSVTHYRVGMPSREEDRNFFISTGLDLDNPESSLASAWDVYVQVQKLVEVNPLGILAPVMTCRDDLLRKLNVHQRLLATAIGLSMNGLDEASFSKVFGELCVSAKNMNCHLEGSLLDLRKTSQMLHSEKVEERLNKCGAILVNKTIIRPRAGILVDEGTDTLKMAKELVNDYYMI